MPQRLILAILLLALTGCATSAGASSATRVHPENAVTARGVVEKIDLDTKNGWVGSLVLDVQEALPNGINPTPIIRHTPIAVRCAERGELVGCDDVSLGDVLIVQGRVLGASETKDGPLAILEPEVLWLCTYGDPCVQLAIDP